MIRSLLFQIYMTIGTLIIGVAGLPVLFLDAEKKLRFCQGWCRTMLKGLKWINGIKVDIHGEKNIPADGAIIAANHQSMWETMQLFAILPKPVMVLKQELLNIPLFGLWLRASGCIAIDRSAGAKAMRHLIEQAKIATAQGGQIIIFPEGTRSKPGTLAPLKPGIAGIYTATGVACLPVGHDSGRYWHFPGNRKSTGTIILNFAQTIPPGLARKNFMAQLEQRMHQARPDLQHSQRALAEDNTFDRSFTATSI